VAVSNQQPPYGQPPQYGQPPYGQGQYGGYPPPPPPPTPEGSNKTVLIVFSVVVAMVVLGAGIFIVSRFTGGSDTATAGGTTTSAPATTQPTQDTPTEPAGSPSEPAETPSASASKPASPCSGCLPGVTVNSLLKAVKAKGYACKLDRYWKCTKGNLDVNITPDYTEKAFVSDVDVSGSSTARVQNCPQCITGAVAALRQGLPGVLALFVKDANVRQQIVAFTVEHAGVPASGPGSAGDATIGGYRLSLLGYSGATVGKNGKYSSSYSTSVTIYGT